MMKKIISFILSAIIAVVPLNISAEEIKTPSGIEITGIGSEIENFANGKNYSSFQTAVFCGDDILYTGRFGYSDMENEIPVDENSVYEWGSITKTLVWVSVMQLYEQGKLELDADIRDYLPSGFFRKLKYDEPITMLDLMNHRGGWQESTYSILVNREDRILSLEDALHYCEPEQVFHPNDVSAYSNWGAALAGYIVEIISGEDFGDYVHEHIFEPLGMEHTSIAPDRSDNMWVKQQREKMKSYTITDSADGSSVKIPDGECLWYVQIYPAGSATGTIDDIAKYGQALVSDNCPLFENQETAELMFSGSLFFGDSDIPSCCHGFFPTTYAVNTVGHNGATNGFTANLQFDRESGFGCAVLASQATESTFTTGIPTLIFGKSGDNPMFSELNIGDEADISGIYLMSREHFKGSLKFLNIGQYIDAEKSLGSDVSVRKADGGLIVLEYDGEYSLLGDTVNRDGERMLSSGGADMIKSDTAKPLFCLCVAYIVIAVLGFILVIALWIMRIINKRRKFLNNAAVLCSANIAKVVSCLCAGGLLLIFAENSGITHVQGTIAGIIQIMCVILYAFSAELSIKNMIQKDIRNTECVVYIFDIAANITAIITVFVMGLCSF